MCFLEHLFLNILLVRVPKDSQGKARNNVLGYCCSNMSQLLGLARSRQTTWDLSSSLSSPGTAPLKEPCSLPTITMNYPIWQDLQGDLWPLLRRVMLDILLNSAQEPFKPPIGFQSAPIEHKFGLFCSPGWRCQSHGLVFMKH